MNLRANTPAEKMQVLMELNTLWNEFPALRLGQLLCIVGDPYYIEDFELAKQIREKAVRIRREHYGTPQKENNSVHD